MLNHYAVLKFYDAFFDMPAQVRAPLLDFPVKFSLEPDNFVG
jgi:hypothetical protein